MENNYKISTIPEYEETQQNIIKEDDLITNDSLAKDGEPQREKSCYENIASWKIFQVDYWWWPTLEDVLWKVSMAVMVLLIWGAMYASTGRHAAPGGGVFNLGILLITAHVAAIIGSYIAIPQLISMLLVGVIFRHTKVIDICGTINKEILGQIRCLALTLVLIRAGLGLDPAALKKLGTAVVRLSFIPCIMETIGLAAIAHFTLNLPFLWSLLMGSTLGAVSPAVTINYLLALKEQGYGEDRGIPTLIIAAASFDDIIAISVFGVVISIIFSKGSLIMKIFQGPIELATGIVCGVILGAIAAVLPHETAMHISKNRPKIKYLLFKRKEYSVDHIPHLDSDSKLHKIWILADFIERHVAFYRSIILVSGSYFAVLLSRRFEMVGAGYLTSIVSSFSASYGWRLCKWNEGEKPVQQGFSTAWNVMQHFLFALIGYELDLANGYWYDTLLQIATLAAGLLVRLMTAFIVTLGDDFNWKERLFITIAWIPKATVQAAMGPTALDLVNKHQRSDEERHYAEIILNMAILAILITAPLGSLGILCSGPRLLSRKLTEPEKQYLNFQGDLEPPWKGILNCLCPKPKREGLKQYMELHASSLQLSHDHNSFHTVI